MFALFISSILSCGLDRQAIRLEEQEKSMLYQSAQKYWEGIRWNIPKRAAAFYEDPLTRARMESGIQMPYQRFTDIKVLHVELGEKQNQETNSPKAIRRKGTVYIRMEGFGLDNVVRSEEQKQIWYRNLNGWWIEHEREK